jgi:hypothetical protein
MKKFCSLMIAGSLLATLSTQAKAQGDTPTNATGERVVVASPTYKGIRLSVIKPIYTFDSSFESKSYTIKGNRTVNNSLGGAIGYAYLPVRDLGFTTNAGYISNEMQDNNFGLMKIDVNAAYTFNEHMNFKSGVNVSKLTGDKELEKFDPGLGAQVGIGVQLSGDVGIDINYVYYSQCRELANNRIRNNISGPEFVLHFTL